MAPLPGTYFEVVQEIIQRGTLCGTPAQKPKISEPQTGKETPDPLNEFDPKCVSIESRFGYAPKGPTSLIFGTDEESCDVVLNYLQTILMVSRK
ncbi:hypothetical protein RRF57_001281 [Xylaria bambusicola]|uniref:Uncharacterized protein n=1 Tax=Xylaria bambusicola TaxID=326684 RepID=A0AAN7YUU0_9PEZI